MGVLLAFAVGYVIGARSGEEGYRDVVGALRAVRDSDEFTALVAASRSHAVHALHELADRLGDENAPLTLDDALARLRYLINGRSTTSSAS